MLKICVVVDKTNSAIDRLAKGMTKYHDNIDYTICDVHPKRPSPEQLQRFEIEAQDADIMDWQYFRSAELLRNKYDWLKDKKHILTHHNPYSIKESNWNNYDVVIANNKTIRSDLTKITRSRLDLIPNAVDHDFWEFKRDWQPLKQVIMVANRIESKKGILPVAIACGELNVRMVLVGAISDRSYFEAIMQTGIVSFHEQISDEKLKELYNESMLHICNSVDNYESGTMPILEAMFSGTPVLTRRVGHVPDIHNGDNMFIIDHDNEDVIKLSDDIHNAIRDKKKLEEVRQAAWNSVKSRNLERRAFAYQKTYRSVLYDTEPVSVIVPITEINERTNATLNAIVCQTYQNIELIVVDDGDKQGTEQAVKDFAMMTNIPVRYIYNNKGDYGLARARNEGAIYATGETLVFCDQRIKMNKDAIEIFMREIQPKTWLYGTKGVKKDFVENFSCIRKEDFMTFGMFCERMDCYGGLSEETRVRARKQGIHIRCIEAAKAQAQGKSKNKFEKRQEIIRSKNRLYKMGVQE